MARDPVGLLSCGADAGAAGALARYRGTPLFLPFLTCSRPTCARCGTQRPRANEDVPATWPVSCRVACGTMPTRWERREGSFGGRAPATARRHGTALLVPNPPGAALFSLFWPRVLGGRRSGLRWDEGLVRDVVVAVGYGAGRRGRTWLVGLASPVRGAA